MEQTEILLAIQQQLTMLQNTIDTLREQSRQKDEEIERLRQIILNLQRARFGQRSEKRTYVLDDRNQQLSMFDTPEKPEETPVPEPLQNPEKEIRVSGHSRKKKRTLEELCASLPVEERIVDLPDDEKVNLNGHALTCIGQEYVRTELVLERAKAKVVKHYRKVYADHELERETGYSEVLKPVLPPPLLAHSYASASVVTDVLMKKYVDAMPLYRQEQMWKHMGVALKRGNPDECGMILLSFLLECLLLCGVLLSGRQIGVDTIEGFLFQRLRFHRPGQDILLLHERNLAVLVNNRGILLDGCLLLAVLALLHVALLLVLHHVVQLPVDIGVHPVNLQYLPLHLAKNTFVTAPTHLCGIALSGYLFEGIILTSKFVYGVSCPTNR